MALRMRLTRKGGKKHPVYRIVVADSRSPRDGRFIERIGTYNPLLPRDHENRVTLNTERAQYWLNVGAQPSRRVATFLSHEGLGEKPAVPNQTKKHKPKAKAQERMKTREEKAKAAADAAKAEAEAPAEEAEETPAEA